MRRLGIALGVGLLSLILLELEARVIYATPRLARYFSSTDSASWERLWMAERGQRESDYQLDRYDATKGWFSKANYRGTLWNEPVSTNSLGLRGTREFAIPKPEGLFRMVVLGDSFTFGEEVGDGIAYPEVLDTLLPGVEVVNLGVHGYGHDQMTILFEEIGPLLEPDVVLLGFFRMDMSRNELSFRDFAKPMFELRGDGLALTHTPVPTPEAVVRLRAVRPRLWDLFSFARHRFELESGALQLRNRERTVRILARLAERIDALGARGLYVYLPALREIHGRHPSKTGDRFLLTHCPEIESVSCASTLQAFAAAKAAGRNFRPDGHWGALGHRTAAAAIAELLRERRLLPAVR